MFLLVELTYVVLMREPFRQAPATSEQQRAQRIQFVRAWIMVAVFASARFAVFVPAGIRLALTATFLVVHVRPSLDPAPRPRAQGKAESRCRPSVDS